MFNIHRLFGIKIVSLTFVSVLAFSSMAEGQAWKTDIGWTQLRDEIGPSLEDGTGIIASLVEARTTNEDTGAISYLPNVSNAEFAGKTIFDGSGQNVGSTGHATTVGRYLFGSSLGNTPGIDDITGYDATDWLDRVTGQESGGDPLAQVNQNGQTFDVQNHSYISNGNGEVLATDFLERVDFIVNRDNSTIVVGANNGATRVTPELLSSGYNSITVGRSDGNHSHTPTTIYGAGRTKPDIVAPRTATSFATPVVGGAAAILRQAGAGTNAVQNETVKAILLAGATRDEPEFGTLGTTGLDETYGAGELNIYNSYQILQGGEQEGSSVAPIVASKLFGYDYEENIDSGDTQYYNFDLSAGAHELSAVLTWNILVEDLDDSTDVFDALTTFNDLDLSIYDSTGGFLDTLLLTSDSTVDNVELLYLTDLDAGLYTLAVSRKSGSIGEQDFALAFAVAIPEPGSAVCLMIVGIGYISRRRRCV